MPSETPSSRSGGTVSEETGGQIRRAELGEDVQVDPGAVVGYVHDPDASPASVGNDSTIRSGTIIYADVDLGTEFVTGHDTLVREETTVGDSVALGTKTVVDGHVTVGSDVSVQTGVYVPPETTVGDRVFLGPHAVLTNDQYPLRQEGDLEGPTIQDDASIGANATVLPGVTIGEGAFVAAGAVVTDDVPPQHLAVGAPADCGPLPEQLQGGNKLE